MSEKKRAEVWAIVSQKGGVGKTTLAITFQLIALLLLKLKSKLIDCDFDQYSSTEVMILREEAGVLPSLEVEAMTSLEVEKNIESLCQDNDLVLLECGGRNDEETKAAMMLADKIISFTSPSVLDIKTLKNVEKLIEESCCQEKIIILVPTMISTNPKDNDLKELVQLVGAKLKYFKFSKNYISRRKVFYKSFETGKAVFEMKGKYKNNSANFEVKQVFEEIYYGKKA